MGKYIATALMLVGLALGLLGLHVWTGCGYDCSALSYPSLTATGSVVAGLLVVALGLGVVVALLLGSSSGRD